ncbi:MAG: DUF3078 domain-containing protein [Muribaculaceae bacterium]|nr:DUF3078 domain-containing protein [Muribaculaceae bacterium]
MRRYLESIYSLLLLAMILLMPQRTMAQSDSTSQYLLMPLVFDRQQSQQSPFFPEASVSTQGLKLDDGWLNKAQQQMSRVHDMRYRLMIDRPELVPFNEGLLPKPPKEVVVEADPSKTELRVEPKDIDSEKFKPVDRREVKMHNWLHTFVGSLHGTQAYISNNWYQGGENNLNLLGDVQWDCNLNQKLHPNWLFNNTLHYRLGVATAKGDSLRSYSINEDNFQFNSQLGYKAVKNWYYSATLLFKTQLLNSYVTNTRNLAASFLSSGELNVGLGMTYNYKDKEGYKVFTLSIAPLSYNIKICRDIVKLDPTKFGIDAGHHTKHNFGSNVEAKFEWKITPSITWKTRFYAFTDYHYVQGDWENTLSFAVNSFLNTQIFTHLRYDKSRPWNEDWKYWQFKEILSFGLTYKFATK